MQPTVFWGTGALTASLLVGIIVAYLRASLYLMSVIVACKRAVFVMGVWKGGGGGI